KPDPAIKVALDKKMEFYGITLVADFAPGKNAKFVQAEISVKLESKGSTSQVYSIAPLRVDEKQKVTKTWGVSPKVELGDVKANPGISYKSQREYEDIHPQIIGYYSVGDKARWEYLTTKGVEEIIGTQVVEFMVRQTSTTTSNWSAIPDVSVDWRGRRHKIAGVLAGNRPQLPPNEFRK